MIAAAHISELGPGILRRRKGEQEEEDEKGKRRNTGGSISRIFGTRIIIKPQCL